MRFNAEGTDTLFPFEDFALIFAPLLINARHMGAEPPCAAKCNGVNLSPASELTLTLCLYLI